MATTPAGTPLTPVHYRPKCPSSGKLKLTQREAKVIVRRMRADGSEAGIYRCPECKALHVASSVSLERGYRGGDKQGRRNAAGAIAEDIGSENDADVQE